MKVNSVFLFQVLAHLALIPMLVYGSWIHWLVAIVVYFFNGCIGTSATYHRLLAHKSYKAPKWWEYFGTICTVIGGIGSSIAWCSIHREHHRFVDTGKDPHAPSLKGWAWVQFFSMLQTAKPKYAPDLLRSKFHMSIHKYYWWIHLAYALICFMIDPFAVVYAYLIPAAMMWQAGSTVNTLAHMFGSQDYDVGHTRNNWLVSLLMWGEGWHNNHHADATNHRFGKKWWQFDPTAFIIERIKL